MSAVLFHSTVQQSRRSDGINPVGNPVPAGFEALILCIRPADPNLSRNQFNRNIRDDQCSSLTIRDISGVSQTVNTSTDAIEIHVHGPTSPGRLSHNGPTGRHGRVNICPELSEHFKQIEQDQFEAIDDAIQLRRQCWSRQQ